VRHWLVKTEPDVFSIADLRVLGRSPWDGVRNYQARNFMRDDMRLSDPVLVYHSNAKPPALVGLAEVVREAYPDHTSWDPESSYHDPASTPEDPRWCMVDIGWVETFGREVPLDELRSHADGALADMPLVGKSRLSVQPVTPEQFRFLCDLAGARSVTPTGRIRRRRS